MATLMKIMISIFMKKYPLIFIWSNAVCLSYCIGVVKSEGIVVKNTTELLQLEREGFSDLLVCTRDIYSKAFAISE